MEALVALFVRSATISITSVGTSMTFRFTLLIGTAVLAIGLVATVEAGVREPPTVGPRIEGGHRVCDHNRGRDLVVTSCDFHYVPREQGGRKTWSTRWLQMAITPRRGWCVTGVRGLIKEKGSALRDGYPGLATQAAGKHLVDVPFGPPSAEFGHLRQSFTLARGDLARKTTPRGDGLRWSWRGRSRSKTIAIVVAAVFSRPRSDDPFDVVETELGAVTSSAEC